VASTRPATDTLANFVARPTKARSVYQPQTLAKLLRSSAYGLAGAGHIPQRNKNRKEWTAMLSDFGVSLILAAFIFGRSFLEK